MIGPKLIRRLLRASTRHTRDYDLWDYLLNDEIRGTAHRDEHLRLASCSRAGQASSEERTPFMSIFPTKILLATDGSKDAELARSRSALRILS
jgi:hypothetical protein